MTATWQDCFHAGMTLEQAAAARGKHVETARHWANRNGVLFVGQRHGRGAPLLRIVSMSEVLGLHRRIMDRASELRAEGLDGVAVSGVLQWEFRA